MVLAYDRGSRVTGMTWTLGQNPVGDSEYSYDAGGHVLGKSGSLAQTNLPSPVGGNTFNAANAMTAFGPQTLSYDANGNLASDGTNTYTWDSRNHLNAISGGSATSFQYDPFGRRVLKTINGVTTQFLYDGPNPVQELDGGSPPNVTANLFTGRGIDEYFTRTDSVGTRNFLTDMLGSTIALADSAGTLQTQYSYDPFGNVSIGGAASANPYQFTGRENDGTGSYFYRARYYSPTFQRFVAQDPIAFRGGMNLYAYVEDDPIGFFDAFGWAATPTPAATPSPICTPTPAPPPPPPPPLTSCEKHFLCEIWWEGVCEQCNGFEDPRPVFVCHVGCIATGAVACGIVYQCVP